MSSAAHTRWRILLGLYVVWISCGTVACSGAGEYAVCSPQQPGPSQVLLVPYLEGMPEELNVNDRFSLMTSLPSYVLITPDYVYQNVSRQRWRLGMSPFGWCRHERDDTVECGSVLQFVEAMRGDNYTLSPGARPDQWVLRVDSGSLRGSYGYRPCDVDGPCNVSASEIIGRAQSCREFRRSRGLSRLELRP